MFRSSALSSRFFLTSSSMQTVLEGTFALAFVIILAVPLIVRIHRLLEETSKESDKKQNASAPTKSKSQKRPSTTTFPSLLLPSTSPSESSLHLDIFPIRKSKTSYDKSFRHRRRMPELTLEKSPSFTDDSGESQTFDDSAFDYRAYRYKLMKEVLKRHYNERQPPGEVVMNSIHLNSQIDDSKCFVHDLDFFCFADDYYEPADSRKRKDLLHPLDHFLVKGSKKLPTEEKSIETRSPSLWSFPDVTSEVLSSVKNEENTDAPLVGTAVRLESQTRQDAEVRPKTSRNKLTVIAKSPKSYGQPKSFYKTNCNHADILHIESSPMRGESSSDMYNSMYETRIKENKNTKRPWMSTLRPDSFNRKYAKLSTSDARWRARIRSREPSPQQSAVQSVAQQGNSVTSLGSEVHNSTRMKVVEEGQRVSESLHKVHIFSSSMDNGNESSFTRSRTTTREAGGGVPEADKSVDADSSLMDTDSKSPVSPPAQTSNPSSPNPRKCSRLPLHVNSKKPISSKLRKDTESSGECNEKRQSSLSLTEAPKSQRPKTSSAAYNRSTSRTGETEEDKGSTEIKGKGMEKNSRPKTAESFESKESMSRSRREGEENKNEAHASSHHHRSKSNTRNPNVMMAMNQGLKMYIEKLKVVLADHEKDTESTELANLSLSEAVTSDLEANLTAAEIHELRDILQSAEKKLALSDCDAQTNN